MKIMIIATIILIIAISVKAKIFFLGLEYKENVLNKLSFWNDLYIFIIYTIYATYLGVHMHEILEPFLLYHLTL